MSDIKMSNVFSLPLDATYDNLQDANGYEVACFEITIQDEAAAHAINAHDALIEQNKALIEALEHIKKHQETVIVGMPELSATWQIASRALEK